jgi:hypothetical protein
MVIRKVAYDDPELNQRLEYLYSRRSAVERLIRSLEIYEKSLSRPRSPRTKSAPDTFSKGFVSHRARMV